MQRQTWGSSIWEEKNQNHGEIGVILGTGFGKRHLDRNTDYHFNLMKKEFLSRLQKPGSALLDVGVGPMARFAIPLAQMGYKVTGLDTSNAAIQNARKHAAKIQITNMEFIESDFTSFRVPTKFDGLYCIETFYHVPAHLSLLAFDSFNQSLRDGALAWVQFALLNEYTPGFLLKNLLYFTARNILKAFFNKFGRKAFYVTVARHSESEIQDISDRTGFEIIYHAADIYCFRKVG